MRTSSAVAFSLLAISASQVVAIPLNSRSEHSAVVARRGFEWLEEAGGSLKNVGSKFLFGNAAKDISLAVESIGQNGLLATDAEWKVALKAADNRWPGARSVVNRYQTQILRDLKDENLSEDTIRVAKVMRDQGKKKVAEALRNLSVDAKTTYHVDDVVVVKKTNWKKPVAIVGGVAVTGLVAGSLLAEIIGKPVDLSKVGPLPPSVDGGAFNPEQQQQILYYIQQHPTDYPRLMKEIEATPGITEEELQLFRNADPSNPVTAASKDLSAEVTAQTEDGQVAAQSTGSETVAAASVAPTQQNEDQGLDSLN